MIVLILDFLSILFLVLSFGLLGGVILRNFKGMAVPPYWVYFIGGFILLSVSAIFLKIVPNEEPFFTIEILLRFVAGLSIFLGSFEIYRRYESSVAKKINMKIKK